MGRRLKDRQGDAALEVGTHHPSQVATPFMGFTPTWNLVVCFVLGVGCLILPPVLHANWEAAASLYVTGALVIAFSALAMAEVARALRFTLMLWGVWLLVFAPWTLLGTPADLRVVEMLIGAALMTLSYPRGPVRQKYAGWERFMP